MSGLDITYAALERLTPDPKNARIHSDRQIEKIATSIRRFGFNNPILVDRDGAILCGHGRYRAAEKLGIGEVPVVCLDHLSPAEKRAYMLADNRISEDAKWAPELLAIELQKLILLDPEFEITDTGFEMAEIDQLLLPADESGQETDPADEVVNPSSVASVTRPGDLWKIGEHLVFCGDALDRASYVALLGRERVEMVFTDPPYNRAISVVSNLGKAQHAEFVQASGEMTSGEFGQFLTSAFANMAAASTDGSIHYVCMDWRGLRELLAAGDASYTELKNLVVWVKANGGMGGLYRSQHELIAVFKSGSAMHRNNVQLGATGRNRTNVWSYAGMNSFGRGRLIERDPHYVDVTLHRARSLLGLSALNLWTGQKLAPLASERRAPAPAQRRAG